MFLNNYNHLSSQHFFFALCCVKMRSHTHKINFTLTYIQLTKINLSETSQQKQSKPQYQKAIRFYLKTHTPTYVSKFITADNSVIEITDLYINFTYISNLACAE